MLMKARSSLHPLTRLAALAALLIALGAPAAHAAAKSVAPAKPTKPSARKVADAKVSELLPEIPTSPIPQSLFNVPANPREGRNPFFPESQAEKPAPKPSPGSGIDLSALVLNGLTSPPRATAMVNGRTFEEGESAEVKLSNGGRLLIKCVEIKEGSAVIEVRGQLRELKLRGGL